MENGRKILGFEKNVFFTGLVSFFMDINSEMVYPLVPLFLANTLGVNKSVIGLIEGVAEATASLLKVFSGWVSDRIGNRKWLMAAGYATSTLSRPFIAAASGWHQVMGSRFVDRSAKECAPRPVTRSSPNPRPFRTSGGLSAFIGQWIPWAPWSGRPWPSFFLGFSLKIIAWFSGFRCCREWLPYW